MAKFIVVMGVSGSGKTSVGEALAARLGWQFYDADNFHPEENVAKMAQGTPLNDDDRAPWLKRLHDLIHDHLTQGKPGILACSALKRRYRDVLRADNSGLAFFYLHSEFDPLRERMESRIGHYMKAGMLQSQFDALEEPGTDEAVRLDGSKPIENLTEEILHEIHRS